MSIEHFNLQDYYYHKAHHAELLRISGTVRLADQARKNRSQHGRISHQVLGWLGQRLVAWGRQLQERYGSNSEVPFFDSSHFSW